MLKRGFYRSLLFEESDEHVPRKKQTLYALTEKQASLIILLTGVEVEALVEEASDSAGT